MGEIGRCIADLDPSVKVVNFSVQSSLHCAVRSAQCACLLRSSPVMVEERMYVETSTA